MLIYHVSLPKLKNGKKKNKLVIMSRNNVFNSIFQKYITNEWIKFKIVINKTILNSSLYWSLDHLANYKKQSNFLKKNNEKM